MEITLRPIGMIHSPIRDTSEAPIQGTGAGIEGWLEVYPAFAGGLLGLRPGDRILILYWLHLADRQRLEVHPRGDPKRPLTGVFATRSPHRPNPIGVGSVTITSIQGTSVTVKGLDAVDGTPLLDIKRYLSEDCP